MSKIIKHTKSYKEGHPNPQKFRSDYELLNGYWKFIFDEKNEGLLKGYEKAFPLEHEKIIVPYPYQSPASGINLPDKQCDVIWYEREFVVNDITKTHIITFGQVDYKSMVFINGIYVDAHEGGFDSFTFDITKYIKNGRNKITLRVEDDFSIDQIRGKQRWRKNSFTCFYTETSGIVRDVYLERVNKEYIKDFSIKADYEKKELSLFINVPLNTSLKVIISDKKDQIVSKKIFEIEKEENEFKFKLNEITGWSCDNAYLYDIVLILNKENNEVDRVLSYCGFTSVKTEDMRFYINGIDTYLKFILNQGYSKETITSLTEDEIVKDILITLEAGFNGARMHEHIPSALNFYYMDLYGLYAWQECPSAAAYSYKAYKQYFKQFPSLIKEHISHPCIIAYVLFNESWGVNEIRESDEIAQMTVDMYNAVKKMVNDRMVISNDGWEHTISDVITFHNYAGSSKELHEIFDEGLKSILKGENAYAVQNYKMFFCDGFKFEGQPIMFSEFAGIAFKKDENNGWGYGKSVNNPDEFLKKYGDILDFIDCHREIRGFCTTQLTDVYQEVNGLYTYNREEKVSTKALKELHDRFK